jgi:hypothetical protein
MNELTPEQENNIAAKTAAIVLQTLAERTSRARQEQGNRAILARGVTLRDPATLSKLIATHAILKCKTIDETLIRIIAEYKQ